MKNIDINRPIFLTRETMAAIVFAAAGCYWIYNGDWPIGLLGLLLGTSLGFMYKGIGFDLSGKRYRIYTGLFQFRFGTWANLPPISGVTLKRFSEIHTSGEPGRMREDKFTKFILMLSVSNSREGVILQKFNSNAKDYAIEIGEQVAEIFNVQLAVYFEK